MRLSHLLKTGLLAGVLSLALNLSATAEWLTDLDAAKAKAAKDDRVILVDFTGSDWCGWCVKMKKDTLDKKEFVDFAEKNLVLLELDFPASKPQSAALKRANNALKEKYGINGFPTFLVLDAKGKELGRQVGYLEGGPEAFISLIKEFKKKGN